MSGNNSTDSKRTHRSRKVGGGRLPNFSCSSSGKTATTGVSGPILANNSMPVAVSPTYGTAAWRGSPSSAPSRPTKDEASALWDALNDKTCSQAQDGRGLGSDRRDDFKRSQSLPSSNMSCPFTTSLLVSPKSISSSTAYGESSTLYGPYESSLPRKSSSSLLSSPSLSPVVKRYSLQPRRKDQNCRHYGLGPFLSKLPESIIYSIIAFMDYFDRQPKMLLVSHGMTKLLTRPEFLFEMKHAHEQMNNDNLHSEKKNGLLSQVLGEDGGEEEQLSNELLLIVGGKCPTKTNNISCNIDNSGGEESQLLSTSQPLDGGRMNRRMAMQNNEHVGIMGYDQRRKAWVRFGGDPLKPWIDNGNAANASSLSSASHTNLHPLSPFGIVDAKPLYLGHPHYCLAFFGGTHYETGMPSSRVVTYSFLAGSWKHWPDMMRARHGEDFVVARAEGCQNGELNGLHQEGINDSIVLIGCDLEFCDCFRCNPPSNSSSRNENQDLDIDMISFVHNECGDACMVSNNESLDKSRKAKNADLSSMGRCEVLDLQSRKWTARKSRAPSCPPDDGGVAVIGGRFVYLPGTCPPPPTTTAASWRQMHVESCVSVDGEAAEIVTPLTQSEVNSSADGSKSPSSSMVDNDQSFASSMDAGDDGIMSSPLFSSLHYRPGLRYDVLLDQWTILPARPYVTTSSPTTCSFNDRVIVLGGYRSSSENALSCYRHREEDSILDYEDHIDFCWWYTSPSTSLPNEAGLKRNSESGFSGTSDDSGEWTFGGGTTMLSHRQAWAHSNDMAAAVAAASALKREMNHSSDADTGPSLNLPCGAPVPVRGATATTYQGRLTMLGGLSTFSRTFYDGERKTIWQFFPEHSEWRRAPVCLPVPALLDGYAFSVHI
ncbi:hypothetical protein ACHAXR_010320 [Thalassiosira sp. AJA248-18]